MTDFIPGWQHADAKGCYEVAIAEQRKRLLDARRRIVLALRMRTPLQIPPSGVIIHALGSG